MPQNAAKMPSNFTRTKTLRRTTPEHVSTIEPMLRAAPETTSGSNVHFHVQICVIFQSLWELSHELYPLFTKLMKKMKTS